MSKRHRSRGLRSECPQGKPTCPLNPPSACMSGSFQNRGVTDLGTPRPCTRGTGITGGPVPPVMPLLPKKSPSLEVSGPSQAVSPFLEGLPFKSTSALKAQVTQRDCSDHAEVPAIIFISQFPDWA